MEVIEWFPATGRIMRKGREHPRKRGKDTVVSDLRAWGDAAQLVLDIGSSGGVEEKPHYLMSTYTVLQKSYITKLMTVTLSSVNRFSKSFRNKFAVK